MSASAALPEPSQDERTMSMLSYVLSLFFGFLPPLIIFFVKGDSRFVRFHTLQLLLWNVLVAVLFALAFVFFFIGIIFTAATTGGGHNGGVPILFLFFMGVFYLILIATGLATLVLVIMFAIKSSQGQWSELPIVGRWAKKFLHI